MKIRYIDGNRFSRAIVAGASKLFVRQDFLNKINVFPIPDSDTGTNMASTMRAIVESISGFHSISISSLSATVADSALVGARGNSGVIMAQYFYGLSREIGDEISLTTERFGNAVKNAISYAYGALTSPKEGTILTVIKDWAENIYNHRHKRTDFAELLRCALTTAKRSLAETTERLEVLKSANVVDAGAQGFVYFLEGITHFISKGRIKDLKNLVSPKIREVAYTAMKIEDIKHRYCTECLIKGDNINLKFLKEKIIHLGESIVLAGSAKKARLHIHTNKPAEVFAIARKSGALLQQKADDMLRQYLVSHTDHPPIALVTDSASDLPQDLIERHGIHIIPVLVSFGESTYIDKITITPEYFYEMLKSENVHPTTSQPPPYDFKNLYSFLLSHYESIISIHIPESVSGTYQNAVSAANSFPGKRITVIDGKSISVALGFVVRKAAELIAEGKTHDEVVSGTLAVTARTQLFVSISSLKYLMRSGRISKMKGWLGNFLHLKPILHIDEDGVPQHCGKSFTNSGALKKVFNFMKEFTHGKNNILFVVAHASAPDAAQYYEQQIKKEFGIEEVPILPASPVLGAHAGIGAAAIGITWGEG